MPRRNKPRVSHKCRIVRGGNPMFPGGYWIETQTLAGAPVMRSVREYRSIESARKDAIACFNCDGWYVSDDDLEGPRTFRPHGLANAVFPGGTV